MLKCWYQLPSMIFGCIPQTLNTECSPHITAHIYFSNEMVLHVPVIFMLCKEIFRECFNGFLCIPHTLYTDRSLYSHNSTYIIVGWNGTITSTCDCHALLTHWGRRHAYIHWKQTSVKCYSKFIHFHARKSIWKYHLRNGGYFVSASICSEISVECFNV